MESKSPQYLLVQKEIYDKGYDTDDFALFVKNSIGSITESINLNEWDLSQIQTLIHHYQEEKKKQNITNNSSLIQNVPLHIQNTEIDKHHFQKTKLLERNSLSSAYSFLVSIPSTDIISNGLLSFKEFQFTIEVEQLQTQCKRTYSELEWLHNHLTNYFPSTIIPSLPKISFFDKYTPEYTNEKTRYVKRFLNTLLHNPLIHYSKVFYDFLSLSEDDFKELMRKQNLEKPPILIKKFETIDGRIPIGTGCDKDDEAEKIKQTIQDKDKAYEQLDKALKDVIEQFGVLSTKMNLLSKAFENIKHSYKDSAVLQGVFDNLAQLTLTWSNSYFNQKEVFQYEFREFLKYERMYMNDFLNIYQQYDTAKYKYMSQYLSYDSIKGLPNQTLKELNELRKWYGFHLNKLINEYNSLIKHVAVFDFQKQVCLLNEKSNAFYKNFIHCSELLKVNVDLQTQ